MLGSITSLFLSMVGGHWKLQGKKLPPPGPCRVAVVGLYRSGTSAIAGILDRLGVDMGAPYWFDFYESLELRALLIARHPFDKTAALRQWIKNRSGDFCGGKHPLLSFYVPELEQAWSPVKFIWAKRKLQNAINSLAKQHWATPATAPIMQQDLAKTLKKHFKTRQSLQIQFTNLMKRPESQIRRIVQHLGLQPTKAQLAAALTFVKPTSMS